MAGISQGNDVTRGLWLTSLNFFEAASEPPLRSGCHFKACKKNGSVVDASGTGSRMMSAYHLLVSLLDILFRGIPVNP